MRSTTFAVDAADPLSVQVASARIITFSAQKSSNIAKIRTCQNTIPLKMLCRYATICEKARQASQVHRSTGCNQTHLGSVQLAEAAKQKAQSGIRPHGGEGVTGSKLLAIGFSFCYPVKHTNVLELAWLHVNIHKIISAYLQHHGHHIVV